MSVTVVIADDQDLVRSGLRMLLHREPDIDVVGEARDGREAVALVEAHGTGPAGLAGRLMTFACDRYNAGSATIGDAGAVCAVIEPEALSTHRLPVRVELAGTWSRGRTIVDRRDWDGDLAHDPHGQAPAMVEVALGVDAERYARLWLDTVTGDAQS